MFLKKKAIFLVSLEIKTQDNKDNTDTDYVVQEYSYKGISNNENYNKYDEIIKNVVTYWNNQFAADTNPPPVLLDPNLVKAICYQESRVGNDSRAEVDIMQVGHPDDPAIKTLQGKSIEYWLHNDTVQTLKFPEAKVASVYDSVYWGVRWLYHKAQYIKATRGARGWRNWKKAVEGYGPPNSSYANSVWSIYKDGIKKEPNGNSIKLWSLGLLAMIILGATGVDLYDNYPMPITKYDNEASVVGAVPEIHTTKIYADSDESLYAKIVEYERDWWESLSLFHGGEEIVLSPSLSEQSIYSARFVRIKDNPTNYLEVYGTTHQGHGNFYLYKISGNQAILKIKEIAVDTNPDIRFSPENKEKYGYVNCGEVFENDILKSDYSYFDKGTLHGTQIILCEHPEGSTQLIEVARYTVSVNLDI